MPSTRGHQNTKEKRLRLMTTQGQKAGTREQVAKALGEYYSKKFNGKVWSVWDEQKRAYSICGEGLPAHPDLKDNYPNGWSMLDYVKPSEARKLIEKNQTSTKRILSVTVKRRADESPDIYYRRPSESTFATIIERMESLNRGDWCYIGIRAECEVQLTGDLCQTITSGGLWGIESDAEESYLKSIEDEQLAELRSQLAAIGFSKRAISAAFRDLKREEL